MVPNNKTKWLDTKLKLKESPSSQEVIKIKKIFVQYEPI